MISTVCPIQFSHAIYALASKCENGRTVDPGREISVDSTCVHM